MFAFGDVSWRYGGAQVGAPPWWTCTVLCTHAFFCCIERDRRVRFVSVPPSLRQHSIRQRGDQRSCQPRRTPNDGIRRISRPQASADRHWRHAQRKTPCTKVKGRTPKGKKKIITVVMQPDSPARQFNRKKSSCSAQPISQRLPPLGTRTARTPAVVKQVPRNKEPEPPSRV